MTVKLLAVNEDKQKLIGMFAYYFVIGEFDVLNKKVQTFQKSIDS